VKIKINDSMTLILCLLLWSLPACQQVSKPEVRGSGPLAVVMERGTVTPEYHAPLERWRARHKEAIKEGDFSERECVLCHNPQKSCNRCHGYIGAKETKISEALLYWPTEDRDGRY
jgi:hypothetical protein